MISCGSPTPNAKKVLPTLNRRRFALAYAVDALKPQTLNRTIVQHSGITAKKRATL